jgi:hypothetical protein
MNEIIPNKVAEDPARRETAVAAKPGKKRDWETPVMEEVSAQVMAQPYIRFT